MKDAAGTPVTPENPAVPHPYACQIEGCKGRIGQEIFDLGTHGKIRVCLYHHVILMAHVCDVGRPKERRHGGSQ